MVGYQCQRVGESVCCAKFNFFCRHGAKWQRTERQVIFSTSGEVNDQQPTKTNISRIRSSV